MAPRNSKAAPKKKPKDVAKPGRPKKPAPTRAVERKAAGPDAPKPRRKQKRADLSNSVNGRALLAALAYAGAAIPKGDNDQEISHLVLGRMEVRPGVFMPAVIACDGFRWQAALLPAELKVHPMAITRESIRAFRKLLEGAVGAAGVNGSVYVTLGKRMKIRAVDEEMHYTVDLAPVGAIPTWVPPVSGDSPALPGVPGHLDAELISAAMRVKRGSVVFRGDGHGPVRFDIFMKGDDSDVPSFVAVLLPEGRRAVLPDSAQQTLWDAKVDPRKEAAERGLSVVGLKLDPVSSGAASREANGAKDVVQQAVDKIRDLAHKSGAKISLISRGKSHVIADGRKKRSPGAPDEANGDGKNGNGHSAATEKVAGKGKGKRRAEQRKLDLETDLAPDPARAAAATAAEGQDEPGAGPQ